jgi:hypothetical protein
MTKYSIARVPTAETSKQEKRIRDRERDPIAYRFGDAI